MGQRVGRSELTGIAGRGARPTIDHSWRSATSENRRYRAQDSRAADLPTPSVALVMRAGYAEPLVPQIGRTAFNRLRSRGPGPAPKELSATEP